MTNKILNISFWALLCCATCYGQSQFMGIQPGASTRADVEKAFGQSARALSATAFEYNPQSGTGKIEVEYRAGSAVVERIEVYFLQPILRSALIQKFKLTEQADAKKTNAEGKPVEYFNSPALSLTYSTGEAASGVVSLGYYSLESFDRAVGRPPRPAPPPPAATAAPPPSQTATQDIPDDVGVYIKERGKLVEVHPEVVTLRTGGILKSMATSGLTKGHVNGVVKKPHSPLQTGAPVEFIIRCPEGVSVTEYQLLKLDEKDDRREFRAITGGVFHASSGSEKNAVEFKFEKIAPRTFKIVLSRLKSGEYGFVPPGEANPSMAARIYTFGIE